MIATLLAAFLTQSAILVLICIIVELGAYVWYTASYIPYGRSCLTNCFKSILRREWECEVAELTTQGVIFVVLKKLYFHCVCA